MTKAAEKNQKNRKRIDQLLVERGLALDLKEAASLVMAGKVVAGDQRVDKPGTLIERNTEIRVKNNSRYVSRGGDKLEGALKDFAAFDLIAGKTILDIGASTGGFSDCCLKAGASHVVAVDVGTNQLAWGLRSDRRVTVLEQTDIRTIDCDKVAKPDIVVGDVSFVSLEKIADAIVKAGGESATDYFLLVKPQFELDVASVPKGGVVIDESDRMYALSSAKKAFEELGLSFVRSVDSRVAGASGNREIFVWFKKT